VTWWHQFVSAVSVPSLALILAAGSFAAWFARSAVRWRSFLLNSASVSDNNAKHLEQFKTEYMREVGRLREELDALNNYSHIGIELLKVQIRKEYDAGEMK